MLDSILSAAEPTSTPTTPNSQDVTAALDVITERGDIILQLGKDEESLNLLVSSVALGLASPVFEAMFDGRFAEGQSLSTNSTKTIPLPDDNPECVAMLCMIVHMRTEELPKTLSATKLADFAVVCDKYCCVSAVQAWARIWTAEYLSNSNSKDFEKILFVTYVLRLAKEFKQATQSIIRDRTKVLSINAATHAHNFLPAILFDGISKERERCQEESLAAFSVGTSELKSSALSLCPRMISVAGVFLQKLKDAQLWPLGNTSLESLKERARDMGKIEQPSSKCHCYPDQEHRASNIHQQLLAELERLYNSVGGFCVECVKLGSCDDTHPCSHDLAPDVES